MLLESEEWCTGVFGASIDNNPSPGNKAGGITTIYEKSLCAVAKGGGTALSAVCQYAEPISAKGSVVMDTPGFDPVGETNAFEIHMTEFRYFGSVSNDTVSGLFDADTYATALKSGAESVHFLEMGSSFLSDNAALNRGPAFRAFQMLGHLLDSSGEMAAAASNSSSLRAYAVRQADGKLALMMINLTAGADAVVSVGVSGMSPMSGGSRWSWGDSQPGDPAQASIGGLGSSFTITVPQRTMMVLLLAGLPGDFNGDGTVDAADYVVWRNGLGTKYSQSDYDVWRAHFGVSTSAATGPATSIAIPESPAIMQLIVGMMCLYAQRWIVVL